MVDVMLTDFNNNSAVLLINIDNFNDLDTVYGYEFGDFVLKNIYEIFKTCFHSKELLCEYGRGYYALFIPRLKKSDEAYSLANDIIKMFNLPWRFKDVELYSTASVGIAKFPHDGRNCETLLKNANVALQYAIHNGRQNCQRYSKSIDALMENKFKIEYDLREAIVNEDFCLYYQPIVEVSTGRVISVEALIRWVHPVQNIIPPNEFIPIAEETGLIHAISNWVYKTSFKEINDLNRSHKDSIRVAVNLSARELEDYKIAEEIICAAEKAGFDLSLLDVEITEESAIKDVDNTKKILQELKQRKVKISLDDFCTGYSSLCYLQRLPIDKIKIDRSFIKDIESNKKNKLIVEALINLAHMLELRVVAEGVETIIQKNILKKCGCDLIQGYYYSKPMPYDELVQYINKIAV
jgi:diguanylate cyclase (GGDEF)-like protein